MTRMLLVVHHKRRVEPFCFSDFYYRGCVAFLAVLQKDKNYPKATKRLTTEKR